MQNQNESMTVVIELFKGDRKVVDLVIAIDYQGEFVVHTTENAMRTRDEHQAAIYPERAMDGERGNFVDGFGVMLFPARSLFSPATAR